MSGYMHHQIRCAEIWGGVEAVDQDLSTSSLAISIYSAPCAGAAGGDIYYVSVCGGDQLTRIAIADLQGHGEGVSAMSRRIYASLLDHLGDLDNCVVLAELNRFALEQGFEAMTTAVVVSFLLADGTMSYTYAGHPPVLLHQTAGQAWLALEPPRSSANPALGVFGDAAYEQRIMPLGAGDRFCVYTDGIIECPDAREQPWGARRFREALARQDSRPLPQAKSGVLAEVEQFAGGRIAADDATLVMVEVL
jgi:sigma-B regulation protein RsbU (phosphoserine phosphatase)